MAGNFFSGLADGLNQGVRLGLVFRGLREQEDLRNELAMAAGLGPEVQVKARPATEAEIALAKDPNDAVSQQVMRENAEFGVDYNPARYLPASPMGSDVQGWKLGNTAYGAKPTKGLIAAAQMEARGRAHEKFGDAEKGATLVEKAEDMRLKEIKNIGEQALQAGTYQAIEDAYNLIYNDKQFKRVDLGGGRYRVLHGPIGAPDSLFETVVEGTEPEILDYAAKNIDAKTWADLREQESQIKYRDKLGSHYDWQRQKAEQDYQLETYRRQIEAIDDQINKMPPDAVEEVARLYQERDKLMQAWAGMSQGLSGTGGAVVTGNRSGVDLGVNSSGGELKQTVSQYAPIVQRAVQGTMVTPELVMSVMQLESSGNAAAVSPKGARGLMQLMPDTAKRFGVTDIHDPEQNITGGVKYLDFLLRRYNGDVGFAVAAYNAGEGRVDDYVQRNHQLPPETRAYVPKVMSIYNNLGGSAQMQPQQGLTAQPGTVDPRFMQIAEARKRAAVQPKSPQAPMSVNDWKVFGEMADGLLENDTAYRKLTSANDRLLARNKKVQELYNNYLQTSGLGGGGAGWDANTSMGQLANGQAPGATGTPEGNGGGLTGQDFSAFATATAAAAREEESKAASAKDQARFDHMVSTWAAGYKQQWFRDEKTRNPAYALDEARKAIAQIETLYPSLSAEGKKSAELALRGFWKTFPELMPKAAN